MRQRRLRHSLRRQFPRRTVVSGMAPRAQRRHTAAAGKRKSTGNESLQATVVLPTIVTRRKSANRTKTVKVDVDLDIEENPDDSLTITPRVTRRSTRTITSGSSEGVSPLNYDGPMTRSRAKELQVKLMTPDDLKAGGNAPKSRKRRTKKVAGKRRSRKTLG